MKYIVIIAIFLISCSHNKQIILNNDMVKYDGNISGVIIDNDIFNDMTKFNSITDEDLVKLLHDPKTYAIAHLILAIRHIQKKDYIGRNVLTLDIDRSDAEYIYGLKVHFGEHGKIIYNEQNHFMLLDYWESLLQKKGGNLTIPPSFPFNK